VENGTEMSSVEWYDYESAWRADPCIAAVDERAREYMVGGVGGTADARSPSSNVTQRRDWVTPVARRLYNLGA
jgi:hypothetical protein